MENYYEVSTPFFQNSNKYDTFEELSNTQDPELETIASQMTEESSLQELARLESQKRLPQQYKRKTFYSQYVEPVVDIGEQVLGGALDVVENVADIGGGAIRDLGNEIIDFAGIDKEDVPDILTDRLVLNIPGLDHYDPNKEFIFTMSNDEFNKLYENNQISHAPTIQQSDSVAGQLTREFSKALVGIYAARAPLGVAGGSFAKLGKLAAGTKAVTTGTQQTSKILSGIDYLAPGVIGSMFSYKPDEPRLANSLSEIVENTPLEFSKAFFTWMSASEDEATAEAYFKMALESVTLDIGVKGFSKLFKMFKRERSLLKAESRGASEDQLDIINKETLDDLINNPNIELPPSLKDISDADEFLAKFKNLDSQEKTTLEKFLQESVITSKDEFDNLIRSIAATGAHGADAGKVFNTKMVTALGARRTIDAIASRMKPEFERAYAGIPKGPKRLADLEAQGKKLYQESERQRADSLMSTIDETADHLSIDRPMMRNLMYKDLDNLADIESRVVAYRMVVSQMASEIGQQMDKTIRGGYNVVDMARVYNNLLDFEDTLRVFGEVRRTGARMTTIQRLEIPCL